LSVVEFDDQGWFADRKQMEALFALLDRIERNDRKHALILLYVHGWKHNASQCDDNVICFSRLVERMDILERHVGEILPEYRSAKEIGRTVVGVYVGWRGLSVDAGFLTNTTFWTRKATAERVGRGGVKELLTRLEDYRASRNPHRDLDKTQLVIAGHSFGGQVIYSALSHVIMERAAKIERFANAKTCDAVDSQKISPEGLACYDTARSFGDFVVLVNPAFEGSVYEPLFHIATNRCYRANQRPVMMTITSSGDAATGAAFPLGRRLSTALEHRGPEQSDSMLRTVGHNERYETHQLKWHGTEAPPREPTKEDRPCGCSHLEPTTEFFWRDFQDRVQAQPKSGSVIQAQPGERNGTNFRVYRYGPLVTLEGHSRYAANYPYLVVTADPEIIHDHNSIYQEPFIKFLHTFFLLHIASRHTFEADGCYRDAEIKACSAGGSLPCEESCRWNGKSCSVRSSDAPSVPR